MLDLIKNKIKLNLKKNNYIIIKYLYFFILKLIILQVSSSRS